jgi:hypothetical protein
MMSEPKGLLMKYFVLKPRGTDVYAKASRRAMRTYAALIEGENPVFARELRAWADSEFESAVKDGMLDAHVTDRWGL